MTSLTQFSRFQELPTEIRIAIWDLIPFPTRTIGLVPNPADWSDHMERGAIPATRSVLASMGILPDTEPQDTYQQPYQFRYAVQPQNLPIFPLLHVNHEARSLWLSRLERVPQRRRQVSGDVPGTTQTLQCTIQFDTPFIHYETDIISAFADWPTLRVQLTPAFAGTDAPDMAALMDPLFGLDRTRIQHLGLGETPFEAESLIRRLDFSQLPALRSVTIITLGPRVLGQRTPAEDKRIVDKPPSPWRELHAADISDVDCVLRDLPAANVATHPLVNGRRLLHTVQITPTIRPLPRYTAFVKAWIWHSARWLAQPEITPAQVREAWWPFGDYLFEDPRDDAACPLPFAGCGDGGHGKREMMDWTPPFEMCHKMLCPVVWIEALDKFGLFDEDYVPGSDGIDEIPNPGIPGLF
ncbi:hypothetical protein K4F52_002425 [Lecanicillium sp. MT-2017a]|nr:hypothetical protein K4F52_002425 [Lecanicillium sp. MT-2017a]